MIRVLSVCMLMTVFFSCTDNTKVPSNVIPQDKMEKIMFDMLQADRFVNNYLPKRGDSAYNDTAVFKVYQRVFNIYGITEKEFRESYKFYITRPDITRTIFDSVLDRAERKRDKIQKENLRKDSLKRADSLKIIKIKTDSLKKDSLTKDNLKTDSLKKDSLTKDKFKTDSLKKNRRAKIKDTIRVSAPKRDTLKTGIFDRSTIKRDLIRKLTSDSLRRKRPKL